MENGTDAQRKKVIAILASAGYTLQNGKPDMVKILNWVQTYGYLKPKTLMEYSKAELTKLIKQSENITQYYLNK